MPDFKTIIIHLLNIAILFIVLRLLIYKPVRKFIDERAARISGELEKADEMQRAAQEITNKAQQILDDAAEQSRAIINDAARKAKEDADGIIRMAEQKAKEIAQQALVDAEAEKREYNREIENQIGVLALEIAGRVLRREVKPEDNDVVIRDFFRENGVFDNVNSDKGGQK